MEIAEDPMTGPDDRGSLPVDQDAECVAVTGEDGVDDRPVIAAFVRAGGWMGTGDGNSPYGGLADPRPNRRERFGSPSSCRKASRTMVRPS